MRMNSRATLSTWWLIVTVALLAVSSGSCHHGHFGPELSEHSGAGGGDAGPSVTHAPAASDIVSAGDVCQTDKYWMVVTIGQPSVSQHQTESTRFQLHGGLIRATGD